MKKQDIQKLYKKQKKLLLKYNHHYFNLDSPLVTDSKYDKIFYPESLNIPCPYLFFTFKCSAFGQKYLPFILSVV